MSLRISLNSFKIEENLSTNSITNVVKVFDSNEMIAR